jgi:hypothetical protein
MSWWVPFRMHDLDRLGSDEAFTHEVTDILHRPLLVSLIGRLHLISQISISSHQKTPVLTSLSGAKKFSLIPGVGI